MLFDPHLLEQNASSLRLDLLTRLLSCQPLWQRLTRHDQGAAGQVGGEITCTGSSFGWGLLGSGGRFGSGSKRDGDAARSDPAMQIDCLRAILAANSPEAPAPGRAQNGALPGPAPAPQRSPRGCEIDLECRRVQQWTSWASLDEIQGRSGRRIHMAHGASDPPGAACPPNLALREGSEGFGNINLTPAVLQLLCLALLEPRAEESRHSLPSSHAGTPCQCHRASDRSRDAAATAQATKGRRRPCLHKAHCPLVGTVAHPI